MYLLGCCKKASQPLHSLIDQVIENPREISWKRQQEVNCESSFEELHNEKECDDQSW